MLCITVTCVFAPPDSPYTLLLKICTLLHSSGIPWLKKSTALSLRHLYTYTDISIQPAGFLMIKKITNTLKCSLSLYYKICLPTINSCVHNDILIFFLNLNSAKSQQSPQGFRLDNNKLQLSSLEVINVHFFSNTLRWDVSNCMAYSVIISFI